MTDRKGDEGAELEEPADDEVEAASETDDANEAGSAEEDEGSAEEGEGSAEEDGAADSGGETPTSGAPDDDDAPHWQYDPEWGPAWSESKSGWLKAYLKRTYLQFDPRWLGVWRVYMALLIIYDLLRRWDQARHFYTNEGFLPNHFSLYAPMGRGVFSIYHAFSTLGEVSVAFSVALFCYLCFLAGYRTKLFHALSLFFVTSLNARNIFVENGGTIVVNIILIWTLFLPLGRRLSVDALLHSLRARRERDAAQLNDRSFPVLDNRRVTSVVALGMLIQWSVIYFFNAVTKTGVGWWKQGSALWFFWHQDRIVNAPSIWLRENAPFSWSEMMTRGTLVVEGALAVLLLFPLHHWVRRALFLMAFGLHGGIALSSRLGPFSYVMTGYFILLFGAAEWKLVAKLFAREARARTVVYDADCGICLLICRILKRLDPFERLTFRENTDADGLPEAVPRGILDDTVVAIRPDGSYSEQQHAVFDIVRALPLGIFLVWWIKVPGLTQLAGVVYRAVANRRHRISAWLGLGVCGLPSAEEDEPEVDPANVDDIYDPLASPLKRRWKAVSYMLVEGLAIGWIVIAGIQIIVDNPWLRRHADIYLKKQPRWQQRIVDYPRAYQGWRMFAPEPPFDDGRVVIDARTADGRKVDPFTGQEPDFAAHAPNGWGHSQLWCDYHNRIRFGGHQGNRKHLRDWLMKYHQRTGNKNDRLVAWDVWWADDDSPWPEEGRLPYARPPKKLLSHGRVKDSLATPHSEQARKTQQELRKRRAKIRKARKESGKAVLTREEWLAWEQSHGG